VAVVLVEAMPLSSMTGALGGNARITEEVGVEENSSFIAN
jgi:hypothetical protein